MMLGDNRVATKRFAIALVALGSVLVLATCDIDKLTPPKEGSPQSPILDSTDLVLGGGNTVTLGGTATLTVTSSVAALTNVIKRYYSASPAIVAVDSMTGIMTGVAIGTAKLTGKVLAPELSEGVTVSQVVRVRYGGIRISSPTSTDSIPGLGLTRAATVFGLNNAGAQVGPALTADSVRSRDTTVFAVSGTTLTARKNGTALLVAFFDGFRDSLAVRVRQVAKSITYPTANYAARHMNFNVVVPLTVRDVADATIQTPTVRWRTSDTSVATIDSVTGLLRVKKNDTTSFVIARVDTVTRQQRIVVSQVVASLAKVAGDARSDAVARNVSVLPTVSAADSGNTLVKGATVVFKPIQGSLATAGDTLQLTDTLGRARPTAWKLGDLADTNRLVATAGAASVTFRVVGVAGAPRKLGFTVQPASSVTGVAIAPAIKVAVQDSLGNTVTGASVNVTLSLLNPGSATLGGTLTAPAIGGIATFSNVTVSASGVGYTLLASTGNITAAVSSTFDVYGPKSKLSFIAQPTNSTVGALLASVRVAVQDASGVIVSTATDNVTLTLGTNPGGATLGGTLTAQAVNGIATFSNLTVSGVASGYTLAASATGLTSSTSDPFNIVAVGAPAKLAFSVQPSTAVAGATIAPAIKVQVQDSSGAVVGTSTQTISLAIESSSPSGGALAGPTSVGASGGEATFNALSINKAGTGYRLIATGGSLTSATSTAFTISTGAPSKLAFTQQPVIAVVGQAISPAITVEVQDALGNKVTAGAATSVRLSFGADTGTLGGTTTRSTSNGEATFDDIVIAQTGFQTGLRATATGTSLTNAFSGLFNIVAASGTAARLRFVATPGGGTAGQAMTSVQVEVVDGSGNRVTSAAHSITVAVGSGSPGILDASSTASAIASAGVATFNNLRFNTAGAYTLTASTSGLASGTSGSFNIAAGSAAKLAWATPPANTFVNAPLIPTGPTDAKVLVQDAFGNTTASAATVRIAVSVGPTASLRSNSQTVTQVDFTAANGMATIPAAQVSMTAAGTYQLTASNPGGSLVSAASPSFTVAAFDAKAKLAWTTQPANATYSVLMSPAPTVAIQDQYGNQVISATDNVTLSVGLDPNPTSALIGGGAKAATSGAASFGSLTVVGTGLGYTLTASAPGLPSVTSAAFNVTSPGVVKAGSSSGGGIIIDLVRLGSTIYFAETVTSTTSAIRAISVTGGTATTIASTSFQTRMTTDGTNIYWADQGATNSGDASIKKLTVATGAVTVLASGLSNVHLEAFDKLHADGTNVYFVARNAAGTANAIRSISVNANNGTPTDLFSSTGTQAGQTPRFAVLGGLIYFGDRSVGLRRMTTTGSSLTTLAVGVDVQYLVMNGTTLYFSSLDVRSISNANTITSATTPTVVIPAPNIPGTNGFLLDLELDGSNVYVQFDNTIRRYAIADFSTFTPVTTTARVTHRSLVFDATDIYFSSTLDQIAKLPK